MSTTQLLLAGILTTAIIVPGFQTASAETLDADIKKSERTYRKSKNGTGALTQSMIEACITLKSEIDKEYEKISASKEKFDSLNHEAGELSASLEKKKETLDDQEENTIDEHNQLVVLYNEKVAELKEMETVYNQKSTSFREKGAQLEKECKNQPYYEDDYTAAVKKTGKSL